MSKAMNSKSKSPSGAGGGRKAHTSYKNATNWDGADIKSKYLSMNGKKQSPAVKEHIDTLFSDNPSIKEVGERSWTILEKSLSRTPRQLKYWYKNAALAHLAEKPQPQQETSPSPSRETCQPLQGTRFQSGGLILSEQIETKGNVGYRTNRNLVSNTCEARKAFELSNNFSQKLKHIASQPKKHHKRLLGKLLKKADPRFKITQPASLFSTEKLDTLGRNWRALLAYSEENPLVSASEYTLFRVSMGILGKVNIRKKMPYRLSRETCQPLQGTRFQSGGLNQSEQIETKGDVGYRMDRNLVSNRYVSREEAQMQQSSPIKHSTFNIQNSAKPGEAASLVSSPCASREGSQLQQKKRERLFSTSKTGGVLASFRAKHSPLVKVAVWLLIVWTALPSVAAVSKGTTQKDVLDSWAGMSYEDGEFTVESESFDGTINPVVLNKTNYSVDSDFVPSYFGVVPHVAENGYWETDIAFKNVSDSQHTLFIKAYDSTGGLVAGSRGVEEFLINAHQSYDLSVGAIYDDLSTAELESIASLTIESDGDFVFNERFKANGIMGGFDLPTVKADDWSGAMSQILSDEEYIAHIAESWKWWTGIANYGSGDFVLDIHNADNSVDSFDVSFGDLTKLAYVSEDVSGHQYGSWGFIDSDGTFSYQLFGILNDSTGSNGIMAGLNSTKVLSDEFVIPYTKDGLVDWRGMAVLNPGSEPVTGTISLAYEDTSAFGTTMNYNTVDFSLEPGEKKTGIPGESGYALDLESLLVGTDGKVVHDVIVKVTSDYDVLTKVGGVATELAQGDLAWSHMEGAIGLSKDHAGHYLELPSISDHTIQMHNDNTSVYHEGRLHLVNLGDYPTDALITYYSPTGTDSNSKWVHLEPHESLDTNVKDIYSASGLVGSLRVEAAQPVAGVYTLYSTNKHNAEELFQDESLQSAMFKLQPVRQGTCEFDEENLAITAYSKPGELGGFNVQVLPENTKSAIRGYLFDWKDGSDLEFIETIDDSIVVDHLYADEGTYYPEMKVFLEDCMLPYDIETMKMVVSEHSNKATFTYLDKDGNPTDTLKVNEPFTVHYKVENFTGQEIDGMLFSFTPGTDVSYEIRDFTPGQIIEGEAYIENGIGSSAQSIDDKLWDPTVEVDYVDSEGWKINVHEDGQYTLAGEKVYTDIPDYKQLTEDNIEDLATITSREGVYFMGGTMVNYTTAHTIWENILADPNFASVELNDTQNRLYAHMDDGNSSDDPWFDLGGQTYFAEQNVDDLKVVYVLDQQ